MHCLVSTTRPDWGIISHISPQNKMSPQEEDPQKSSLINLLQGMQLNRQMRILTAGVYSESSDASSVLVSLSF